MRHLPSDKYNVAWFKLAEFVARGEKERALGLYRLLIHSFDDIALAYQLEGDLLSSFNDEEAVERYGLAAQEYKKTGRIMPAIAVYENILEIHPRDEYIIRKILSLYEMLKRRDKLVYYLGELAACLLDQKKYPEITEVSQRLMAYKTEKSLDIQKNVLLEVIKRKESHTYIPIQPFLQQVLEELLVQSDQKLQSFLSHLKAIDQTWYEKAQVILNDE